MKARLGIALISIFYVGYVYSHDNIPKPVREGTFDFRCVGPTGEISKHTSLHTAINACQSKKLLDPTKKYVVEAGPLRMDLPSNTPVDCIGIWTAFTKVPGSEGICTNATRSITEQRTFTIVTPASNGGLACPSSPQTRQSVEPCTMPAINCEGTWSEYSRVSGSETSCINNQRNYTEQRIFNILVPPFNGGTACPTSPESRQLSEPCNISSSVLPDTNSPVLSISPNGRFFRLDGSPYFWIADTGWKISQGISNAEITQYLEDRAAKGIRIIQGPILVASNVEPPYIGDSNDPFIPGNPMTLNDPWWSPVDHAVKEAARLNLILFPAVVWGSSNDVVFPVGQESKHAEFAGLAAKRYSNQSHVSWIAAGEYHKIRYEPNGSGGWIIPPMRSPNAEEMARYNAITTAIRANAHPKALITYHPDGWQQPSIDFGQDTRVSFNMLQSSQSLHENLRRVPLERNSLLTKPVVEAETDYEGNGAPDHWQRVWAYNTFMQGAAGYTYGHGNVWDFEPGLWQNALNTTSSNEVFNYFRKFVEAHHDETNQPAQHLISNVGNIGDSGNSYATALIKGDARKLIVYVTNGRTLQINTSTLAAGELLAHWYSPRLGTYQPATISRGTNVTVDPPGTAMDGNDWALVITAIPSVGGNVANILKGRTWRKDLNNSPGARDLTALGTLDWAYWGRTNATDFDKKSGSAYFNAVAKLTGSEGAISHATGDSAENPSCSWTDGSTSPTSHSGERDGIYVWTSVAGYGLKVTTNALGNKRLRFVFGWSTYQADTIAKATVSDASSSDYSSGTLTTTDGQVFSYETSIVVEASDPTATLTFSLESTDTNGNVGFQYAYAEEWPYEIAVEDTFTGSDNTALESRTPSPTSLLSAAPNGAGASTGNSYNNGADIVSNAAKFNNASEVIEYVINSPDSIIELDWVISSTTGHRMHFGFGRKSLDDHFYYNLRQIDADWNLYRRDAGTQTGISTSNAKTWGTSKTYQIHIRRVGDNTRLMSDGDTLHSYSSATQHKDADRVAIGVAGQTTPGSVDNLIIWRPIRKPNPLAGLAGPDLFAGLVR